MKHLRYALTLGVAALVMLALAPTLGVASQLDKAKTVWVILMENHNWTGNNAGAAFGAPDIKGNPLAPIHQWNLAEYVGPRGAVFQSSWEPSQPAELSMARSRDQLRRPCGYAARPTPTIHGPAL